MKPNIDQPKERWEPDLEKLTIVIFLVIIMVVSCIVLLAFVPPTSRDALIHHLAIPKLYLKNGGIYEIPSLKFSYYPMNLDLLYAIPLYFGSDILPKYIHFFFALLTCWLIFVYLNEKLNNFYAVFGALFFLSLPVIVKLSTTVYVDLGLIFFSTASLIYLIKWMERGFGFKYLLISSIMCGFALGVKYNGIISLFLLGLFAPLIYLFSHKSHQSLRKAAMYGMCFFLFPSWYFRHG